MKNLFIIVLLSLAFISLYLGGTADAKKDKDIALLQNVMAETEIKPTENRWREHKKGEANKAMDPRCHFPEWVGKKPPIDQLKALGRPYRIIYPGQMVTQDHIENRINLHVNEDGIVMRIGCG